jgi:3-hydroxyacyl-[acyl-carrier-protein] dehydratase
MDVGSLIPHRSPFLFIDEVVQLDPKHVLAHKRVNPEDGYFAGHYPGNPVMPGVLVCECAFQAGALLLAANERGATHLGSDATRMPVLTRIRNATFKRMVKPGDLLDIDVVIDEMLDGAYFMTGRVSIGGQAVLRVEFACTMTPADGNGSTNQS